MSFDITLVISLRESFVYARVLPGSQQSVVTFFLEYQVKFLGHDRLVFIRFYQLFKVS